MQKIPFLPGEYWYGGAVGHGVDMPIDATGKASFDFTVNTTPNQAMPLFLSSKGRCLYRSTGYCIVFEYGEILCPEDVVLESFGQTLRDAYCGACERWLSLSGRMPARQLFEAPIFNTWIELTFFQTQQAILKYAEDIVRSGFEPGVLMIDDGWAEYYGDWRFHAGRFPDPQKMLERLHELGFRVMVWLVPYVSPDSMAYRMLEQKNALVRTPQGTPYLVHWWNGVSAALDLSAKPALDYLCGQLDALCALGVDGFKFDGADSIHYRQDNVTWQGLSPNEQCEAWNKLGAAYELNEFRAAWQAAGLPLVQRLCDKKHSWGVQGVAALIPDTLAQGITGHPFGCADMVGGGEYLNFAENADRLDEELFVCHSGVSCLMPAIQFSAAPWRVLGERATEQIHAQLALRRKLLPYLMQQLEQSAKTGEPTVRYLTYEFPNEACECVTNAFMLGERYLVAPILEKGTCEREVYVPQGSWKYGDTVLESLGGVRRLQAHGGLPIVLERLSQS